MNNETVELKIVEHDKKLDEHENKISNLEKSDAKQDSKMDNLCEKIDKLVDTNNKWFYFAVTTMSGMLAKLLFFK